MVTAIGVNTPNSPAASQRSFAEGYVELLALANAAEKAGVDQAP